MTSHIFLRGALAFAATIFLSTTAHAQFFRAYLASGGNDANPCTLQAPCRLLPAALNAVANGGQVWMLDSANYNIGPVNVTKSVSILAVPGAVGSMVATAGPALSVPTPGVVLTLENLRISALAGTGATSGIVLTSGSGLTVRNTTISGMPQRGIMVSGPVAVRISDTTIADCGWDGVMIGSGPQATLLRVVLSRNGGDGLYVLSGSPSTATLVQVIDSIAEGNAGDGFSFNSSHATAAVRGLVHSSRALLNRSGMRALSGGGGAVWMTVTDSVASNNWMDGIAINYGGTRLYVSGNTSVENQTGLYNNGGLAESAGNNAVRNNTTNIFGNFTGMGTF